MPPTPCSGGVAAFHLRQHMFLTAIVAVPAGPAALAAPAAQDTAERLRAAEQQILEGRSYLAARSTLRDMF